MMLYDFEDYLQLERQRQAWLQENIDRHNPFNSCHRYCSCSTCIDYPYRQNHTCQCEQFLQLAPLVRDNCDCLDCPFHNMYLFDEGLYSACGGGLGRGLSLGDTYPNPLREHGLNFGNSCHNLLGARRFYNSPYSQFGIGGLGGRLSGISGWRGIRGLPGMELGMRGLYARGRAKPSWRC